MIKQVHNIYFSPTGNTRLCSDTLTKAIAAALNLNVIDDPITLPDQRTVKRNFTESDFAVISMPTYAGRIPNKILPYLMESLHGSSTYAAVLVTFGNRNCDSSLIELGQTAKSNGFIPLGGASIVTRHAFADIGLNRPDENDLDGIKHLGKTIAESIQSNQINELNVGEPDDIKAYYTPLKEDGTPAKFLKAKPITNPALCNRCGKCVELCPMGSISKNNPLETPGICIKCQACITGCPTDAKQFGNQDFLSHKAYLEKNVTEPAVSKYYTDSLL